MKRFKLWPEILLYWIWFVISGFLESPISDVFIYPDITLHDEAYHYGPCSFFITISFVLMILGIAHSIVSAVKNKAMVKNKIDYVLVPIILVLSFLFQLFFYLSYFGYYDLFGIVV